MKKCLSQGQLIPQNLIAPLRDSTLLGDDTAALQQHLQEDGYLYLRGVLDPDEILAARGEVFARLAAVGEVAEPSAEGISSGHSQRREMASDLGAFWKSVNDGPALRQVTHGPHLGAIMGAIFGEQARPHDFLFLRPSPVGRATLLHYDKPFFARGSQRIHTAWIPLGPVPVSDGPLLVVEGSNRFADLIAPAVAVDYDSPATRLVSIGEDPITLARQRGSRLLTANFAPGDLAVFGMTTLHGTLDNHSSIGRIRLSCDVRYQPMADDLDERYFGPAPKGTTGAGYGELNGAKPLTEPWHSR
ncbi:MAG: hypothetical protein GKR89_01700 [Candidatus Latescibacteria bacterium]|nr:hypothetical protein [Candidatus Latescibacterota bacterium]